MTDPEYDPRTLYVPPDFLNKQTPALKQWWKLKSQYFDVILFFKMGKFYELFNMDADVGVAELNLIYMKGDQEQAEVGAQGQGRSERSVPAHHQGYQGEHFLRQP